MNNEAKTLLIGNFGKPNIGDELILNAALEDYPNVVVMTNNEAFSQTFCEQRFECVPFFPTGMRSWWQFIISKKYRDKILSLKKRGVEQIIFPGGGLFAIRFRAVLLWTFMFLWVRKFLGVDIPIHFQSQGVDRGLSWFSRRLIKHVFSQVTSISVRDKASAKALKELGICEVGIEGDRVDTFLKKQTIWKRGGMPEKLVLINALSEINSKLNQEILERYKDYRKTYLAFEEGDKSYVPKELQREVVFARTKTEIFTYFGKAEQVIGERFHCLVLGEYFCGADNTFVLRIPYSQKVQHFVKFRGIENLIDT